MLDANWIYRQNDTVYAREHQTSILHQNDRNQLLLSHAEARKDLASDLLSLLVLGESLSLTALVTCCRRAFSSTAAGKLCKQRRVLDTTKLGLRSLRSFSSLICRRVSCALAVMPFQADDPSSILPS